MAYHLHAMAKSLVNDVWPYSAALKDIRKRAGNLSVERAAGRIGASRAAWNAWEGGTQRPSYEKLKAIVEEFQVPPELIGYEPPQGWELVPSAWLTDAMEKVMALVEDVPWIKTHVELLEQDVTVVRAFVDAQAEPAKVTEPA